MTRGGSAILVTGVSGVGKTAVGRRLAADLGWTFLDADTDHPAANRAKMRAGIPLTEADRGPWLAAVRERLAAHLARGEDVVLACSALKASHRQALAEAAPDATLVQLAAPEPVVRQRLRERRDHFMGADLLPSQYAAFEPPGDAIVVDATGPVDAVVAAIRSRLRL